MRRQEQLCLVQPWVAHPHARELEMIGRTLDSEPGIAARIEQELQRGVVNPHRGRLGMTGHQVLRVMVIKQLNTFSYEDLEFICWIRRATAHSAASAFWSRFLHAQPWRRI